jgi:hypothetical protein
MAFNKPTVTSYFTKLEEVLNRHPTFRDGSRVYNLDESSTSTVQNTKKLVSPKGVKQLHQIKTQERGVSVTTTGIIGAHGVVIPPAMIFPRKIFKGNMLINCFPGTLGLANESGYNTKETFLEIMKHFIKCTLSSKENPTLLLMDNVDTHFSAACLDLAKNSGVVVFTFPPHCTHKLQPLDVGLFGPFKRYYDSAIHNFILSNPGVPVTIYHVAGFVNEALRRAGTPNVIINSFKKTGIVPYNPNIFDDSDFLMASVTDQPEPTTGTSDEVTTPNVSIPVSNPTSEMVTASQEDSSVQINPLSNSSFVSPKAIRGLPRAKARTTNRKPRRKGKCMVATDTPEKQAIEEREKETITKKKKAEERKKTKAQGKGKVQARKKSKQARVLDFDSNSESFVDTPSSPPPSPPPPLLTLNHSPSLSDFVLVCLTDKSNDKFFVGQITKGEDEDGDMEVSYLRHIPNSNPPRFVFSQILDLHSVPKGDIKVILPKPSKPASRSKRQAAYFIFEFDFSSIKLG